MAVYRHAGEFIAETITTTVGPVQITANQPLVLGYGQTHPIALSHFNGELRIDTADVPNAIAVRQNGRVVAAKGVGAFGVEPPAVQPLISGNFTSVATVADLKPWVAALLDLAHGDGRANVSRT